MMVTLSDSASVRTLSLFLIGFARKFGLYVIAQIYARTPPKKKRRKGLSLGVRVREHVVEVSFQKESLQQFSRHASKSNFRTSGHLLICVF